MLNRVMLIGRLGQDPETRTTTNGKTVTNFSIATTKNWTDKQGQKQSKTTWHRIVTWDKTAAYCGEYLAKGMQVFVEGAIDVSEYTDDSGVKKFSTQIDAVQVKNLTPRDDSKPMPF